MKIKKSEVIKRLNKIIDDVLELAIDLEFGSWEEFDQMIRKMYPDITLPEKNKRGSITEKGDIKH